MLLTLYANHAWPLNDAKNPIALKRDDESNSVLAKGGALDGYARKRDQRIKDAEEFELEGLMSDEEEEPSADSLDSPTSVEGMKETHHI